MSDTPTPSPNEAPAVAAQPPAELPPTIRARLAGRWQIPLLAFSLFTFGTGLSRMVTSRQMISFEERILRAEKLRHASALSRASAYLNDCLRKPGLSPAHRAEFHRLLADTIHLAEVPLASHSKHNSESIVTHYNAAIAAGAKLSGDDWCGLADAQLWLCRKTEAAKAYRQALAAGCARPDRIGRRLIEIEAKASASAMDDDHISPSLTPDLVKIIDSILAGRTDSKSPIDRKKQSSAENYLWAMEQKVGWLLEKGSADEALELTRAAKPRLEGAEERLAVEFSEALALRQLGHADEAEALLRVLLQEWTIHDGLWSRCGWLLGRLSQEDSRQQVALSFYNEVTAAVPAGDIRIACDLGRAECLAALKRYDEALPAFDSVVRKIHTRGRTRYWEPDAVRINLTTIGESLLQEKRAALGVAYLQNAMIFVDAEDSPLRAQYLSRLANAYADMALMPPRNRQLFARAAEMFLELSQYQLADDEAAARSIELAVDNLDGAGMTERMVEVLRNFVRDYPESPSRPTALYRLGRALQAQRQWKRAADAFEEVTQIYPRYPDAARSLVPLAECLIEQGGKSTIRGVGMLISIVDDTNDEQLFDPQARDYRLALLRLADYYAGASEKDEPGCLEKAASRLEDALALYPDDPQSPRLRFDLANCYRKSGLALRVEAQALKPSPARDAAMVEVNRRLARAAEVFGEVIASLAPSGGSHAELETRSLSALAQSHLRAAYLHRADCLFDVGNYEKAVEAYREAVWRYENSPIAVSASMQIVLAHQNLGQSADARAALRRMEWILKKIPGGAFEAEPGMSSKNYWESMVQRLASSWVN
jgi:tetratricopeptide (TPR) repeat protein